MANQIERFNGVVTHIINDKEVLLEVGIENGGTRSFPKTLFNKDVKVDDEFTIIVTGGSGWMQVDIVKKSDEKLITKLNESDEKPFVFIDDDDQISDEQIKKYMQGGEIDIVYRAMRYAIDCHEKVNHLYDGKPYSVHLKMGVDFGYTFLELISEPYRKNVIAAIWLHDTIEDCRLTKNDVTSEMNYEVSELVYAVTNEKGRTRAERANAKYYRGIRRTPYATFVKLADRLANVEYSYDKKKADGITANSMFDKYHAENSKFIWSLIKPEWYEIHQHVLHLFMGHKLYLRYRKSGNKYSPMILHLENMLNQK